MSSFYLVLWAISIVHEFLFISNFHHLAITFIDLNYFLSKKFPCTLNMWFSIVSIFNIFIYIYLFIQNSIKISILFLELQYITMFPCRPHETGDESPLVGNHRSNLRSSWVSNPAKPYNTATEWQQERIATMVLQCLILPARLKQWRQETKARWPVKHHGDKVSSLLSQASSDSVPVHVPVSGMGRGFLRCSPSLRIRQEIPFGDQGVWVKTGLVGGASEQSLIYWVLKDELISLRERWWAKWEIIFVYI